MGRYLLENGKTMNSKNLTITTKPDFDCVNITDEIQEFIQDSEKEQGSVLVFCKGSTAAVTTLEYQPGMIADLQTALEKIAPKDARYEHHKDWGDYNGFSHVRSALMKPSVVIPFENKILQLGTWQRVVILNFDNSPRKRQIILRILK